jgi:hypothetical protein
MSLNFFLKIGILSSLEDLIDDDSIVTFELSLLASNIKRKVCGVLDSFISFLKKYEKKKTHNLSLMLDPRFKSLRLVSYGIGQKHPLLKCMISDPCFLCF